jgi:hypothetical protein
MPGCFASGARRRANGSPMPDAHNLAIISGPIPRRTPAANGCKSGMFPGVTLLPATG